MTYIKSNSDNVRRNAEYQRKWYLANKQKHIARNKVSIAKRAVILMFELRDSLKCVDCGYNKHPQVLQYHHKNPKLKEYSVPLMIHKGFSKEAIQKEIDKCDILCPTCHMVRHLLMKKDKREKD